MTNLLHDLVQQSAASCPNAVALEYKDFEQSYSALWAELQAVATGLLAAGLSRFDRVAVYLPKTPQAVSTMFGTSLAGGVFVPINPLLKAHQVAHILRDCNVRLLVTSANRAAGLRDTVRECPDLHTVVQIDNSEQSSSRLSHIQHLYWEELTADSTPPRPHRSIDTDIAAILYTSGSTGRPKGVVLSHRNIVTGADSVAEYLNNASTDRLLAVLPLSFDYGFSQLSTAFRVGATIVLMDYLLPRDVVAMVARKRITGLAGVPPLWNQLADLSWPTSISAHLRYITNSGGAMPRSTLDKLRRALPRTEVFLMYGLTEAFRSTFLPPCELDRRPDSIGKAIPNAEVLVVRPDGTTCTPNEPGELVHRGSLVAMGYWNDPEKTAERFKPSPGQPTGLVLAEIAVWSGDTVRLDADGFLYFIGRHDEMIKTSGYRVSPTEIEEIVFASGLVSDAVAIGIPHPILGQAIVLVATSTADDKMPTEELLAECRARLPTFMVPIHIEWRQSIPRNSNGKYDRATLTAELNALCATEV